MCAEVFSICINVVCSTGISKSRIFCLISQTRLFVFAILGPLQKLFLTMTPVQATNRLKINSSIMKNIRQWCIDLQRWLISTWNSKLTHKLMYGCLVAFYFQWHSIIIRTKIVARLAYWMLNTLCRRMTQKWIVGLAKNWKIWYTLFLCQILNIDLQLIRSYKYCKIGSRYLE